MNARRAGSMPGRPRARGLTLLGLVLALIPLVVLVLIAFRVLPAYYEHQRIEAILHSMDVSGQTAELSDRELRSAFDRRAQVDDIHSVLASDLNIEKVANNKILRVAYAAKVPLVGPASLLIEFTASSRPEGGAH